LTDPVSDFYSLERTRKRPVQVDERRLTGEENVAPYKVPKPVEYVGEMTLTSVGKVDKKALR